MPTMAPAHSVPELNATARIREGEVSDAVRRERQRIAQLLHDTVCQSISGAALEAAVLSRALETEGSKAAATGNALRKMIRHAAVEIQRIALSLQEGPPESNEDLATPSL